MTDQPVAFINVLDVVPGRQQGLVDLLVEATEQVIRHRPGFAGTTVFASLDGTRVISCARWRSAEDAGAARADPEVQAYAERVAAAAQADPAVFRLAADIG
ncbi:antibiotic biosynthesis monooxygenase [Glycomyces tarimensis]